jgi:hypothetical protein
VVVVGVAAVIAIAFVGCTPNPIPTPTPPAATPRIVTSTVAEPSGMEALLNASLGVDSDGCLFAQGSTDRVTLVWPMGYSVRGDADSYDVVDGNGDVVASSDQALSIGGGGVDAGDPAWGNASCVDGVIWMVGHVTEADPAS